MTFHGKGKKTSQKLQDDFRTWFNTIKTVTSPTSLHLSSHPLMLKKYMLGHPGSSSSSLWSKLVKTLHNSSTASVITNSIAFQLQRGSQQGVPLSPLQFSVFIEPSPTSIRNCDSVSGYQSKYNRVLTVAWVGLLYPCWVKSACDEILFDYKFTAGGNHDDLW